MKINYEIYSHTPKKVFFSIKRQVWAVGISALNEFLQEFEQRKFQTKGYISTRGGTVFFIGSIWAHCESPSLCDYSYHLALHVDERPFKDDSL